MVLQVRLDTNNPGAVPVFEMASNGGAVPVDVRTNNPGAMPVRVSNHGGSMPVRVMSGSLLLGISLSSATIDATGLVLTLVFNTTATGHDGFTIDPSGGAATLTYNSGDGSNTLVFDISREITWDETVFLDYSGGDVEDALGNQLSDITDRLVTNNVPAPADFRVTSTGDSRTTSTGDFRITS